MNSYIWFLSTKGRKQFMVEFEYEYNDRDFVQKMIKDVDDYCTSNGLLPDKSVKYKFVLQDADDALHLIAEYNAITHKLFTYVYEISKHEQDAYNVIYNHRYEKEGLYFWKDKHGLNVNLLDYEWNQVLDVELSKIRKKLSNTRILHCNNSKFHGVEKFNVYKVEKENSCSIYKSILIKDPKIYRTIDDLWDELGI